MYPQPIEQLIRSFSRLPSVGRRTAERFVFHLLKKSKKDVFELSEHLRELINSIKSCSMCWDFSDTSPCRICANTKRDITKLCIVPEPQHVRTIEKTGAFDGKYFIIRGTLQPDDEAVHHLKIPELFNHLKAHPNITEIILAFNPDLPGETTMMFLNEHLKELYPDLKITRLARGLAMGADVQYADEITLGDAFKHRPSF